MREAASIGAIVAGGACMALLLVSGWIWLGSERVEPGTIAINAAIFVLGAGTVYWGFRLATGESRWTNLVIGLGSAAALSLAAIVVLSQPQIVLLRTIQVGETSGPVHVGIGDSVALAPHRPGTRWLVLRVRGEALTVRCRGMPDQYAAYMVGVFPTSGELVLDGCKAMKTAGL